MNPLIKNIECCLPGLTEIQQKPLDSYRVTEFLTESFSAHKGGGHFRRFIGTSFTPIRQKSHTPIAGKPFQPLGLFSSRAESFANALKSLDAYYREAGLWQQELVEQGVEGDGLVRYFAPLVALLEKSGEVAPTLRDLFEGKEQDNNLPSPQLVCELAPYAPKESNLPDPDYLMETSLVKDLQILWLYCQEKQTKGLDESLLDRPISNDLMEKLFEVFHFEFSDCWPLCSIFEDFYMANDESPIRWEFIPFYLPSMVDNGCDDHRTLAFFEGLDSVAAVLSEMYDQGEVSLSKSDDKLIKEKGWRNLVEAFAEAQDPTVKLWNLKMLENHWESFFGELFAKYPNQADRLESWISSDQFPEFGFESVEDVRFVVEYYECWSDMEGSVPALDEDRCGELDTDAFFDAVLEASRATKKMENHDEAA